MAEEPRRSGRATKGQHTKNHDEPDVPASKRSKAKPKAAKAEPVQSDNDDDAIVRCICGATEDEDGSMMICCDQCSAWQHNLCMGVTENENELPDQYLCEQCGPQDHKETLDAIARGEKPWEDRARQKEEERKGRRRKGGKKGKAAKHTRASGARKEVSSEPAGSPRVAEAATGSAPHDPAPKASVSREPDAGPFEVAKAEKVEPSQKPSIGDKRRKSSQHEVGDDLSSKRRKSSVPAAAPIAAANIHDLPAERKPVAVHLQKEIAAQVGQAAQKGEYRIPDGQTAQSLGSKLALQVEHALILAYMDPSGGHSAGYSEKFRAISFNLKKNPTLVQRLLADTLLPDELVVMTSEQMADEKLQREVAKIKEEVEKQHILLKTEGGRRVRKTHKGEEIIEDESTDQRAVTPSYAPVGSPPKGNKGSTDGAGDHQDNSPMDTESPSRVELPDLSVDTDAPPPSAGPQSATNFNMSRVWSSIHSPGHEQDRALPTPRRRSSGVPPEPRNAAADPDIDRLLRDDDNDSAPYSPVDYSGDASVVWQGRFVLPNTADFTAAGRHVAGRDLSEKHPWTQLVAGTLELSGRIAVDQADSYVANMRYSPTSDVSLLSIHPSNPSIDRAGFDRIFSYLVDKNRWGVISKFAHDAVRDMYLIPLPAGADPAPAFMDMLLDGQHTIESPRAENMLMLVAIVRTKTPAPSAEATPRQPHDSPTLAHPPAGQHGGGHTPVPSHQTSQHFSPVTVGGTPGGPPSYGSPQTHRDGPSSQPQQQPAQPSAPSVPTMARFAEILGPFMSAPVVMQILAAIPEMPEDSVHNLRHVLEREPACQNDIGRLQTELARRNASQNSQPSG